MVERRLPIRREGTAARARLTDGPRPSPAGFELPCKLAEREGKPRRERTCISSQLGRQTAGRCPAPRHDFAPVRRGTVTRNAPEYVIVLVLDQSHRHGRAVAKSECAFHLAVDAHLEPKAATRCVRTGL